MVEEEAEEEQVEPVVEEPVDQCIYLQPRI